MSTSKSAAIVLDEVDEDVVVVAPNFEQNQLSLLSSSDVESVPTSGAQSSGKWSRWTGD